jgi:4-amino-4-deoxy-L-arabinose transferase-like glycosyltransferase
MPITAPGLRNTDTLRDWLEHWVWPGMLAYSLALLGTFALATNGTRYVGVALLIVAGVLAVLIWGRQSWIPAFPKDIPRQPHASIKENIWLLAAVAGAGIILLTADLYNAANPNDPFGPAGWLWLLSIALLVAGSLGWSIRNLRTKEEAAPLPPVAGRIASTLPVRRVGGANDEHLVPGADYSLLANRYSESLWYPWETGVFAGIVLLALVLRIWNLSAYPDNIYPDEIMTGTVALGAYGGSTAAPSLFSTLWSQIDLPALWFRVVWAFLQIGGHTLTILRTPAALFGAATTIPFYLLVRGVWGRAAAIGSTAILAFSASNIHYSRLALNNIVTPFFWAICFLFLLRGLRSGKPIDWAVAGLAAGVSEHFYYGTRLLPFILVVFFAYLLVIHWQRARRYMGRFALLTIGYLVGFGPLLVYFIRNPNLYFGRGAEMSVWHGIPTSLDELRRMIGTLWPIMAENLLGFSTRSSQDIIFFAPLLFPAEAALIVLGVGLLVWNWKRPAAFLMLLSGAGVLFVGGTLVMSINSAPSQINHWTPAFPVFYATLGIPIGAWSKSGVEAIPLRLRWAIPAVLATGLAVLAALNINFYFNSYHADPNRLTNDSYRTAQHSYDALTAQSRYVASLGPGYKVAIVGRSRQPYDATTTYYLMGASADVINVTDPNTDLSSVQPDSKGIAFIFFPGNEQYEPAVRDRWPGGTDGQVESKSGKLLFYTYMSYAPPEK